MVWGEVETVILHHQGRSSIGKGCVPRPSIHPKPIPVCSPIRSKLKIVIINGDLDIYMWIKTINFYFNVNELEIFEIYWDSQHLQIQLRSVCIFGSWEDRNMYLCRDIMKEYWFNEEECPWWDFKKIFIHFWDFRVCWCQD